MGIFDDPKPFVPFKPGGHRKPLGGDEADAAYRKLIGYSSSALQTGLHALDTPGSWIRGGLGSLTGAKSSSEDGRISGRDLTNSIGLTGKNDKGWGAWGTGLAADIVADPLTYLTLGTGAALTNSGKALAKIGATRGMSRKAMLEGFHDTESGLLARGHSLDHIEHLRDSGQRIATPEMERAIMQADPARYVSRPSVYGPIRHNFTTTSANGNSIGHTASTRAEAYQRTLASVARITGAPLPPGASLHGVYSTLPGVLVKLGVHAPSVAGQALGGLAGFGKPFGNAKFVFGTGGTAQRIAGGLDKLGSHIKYDTMLGRWVNALFDADAGGHVGGASQRAMVEHGSPALESARVAGRDTTANVVQAIDNAIRSGTHEAAILRGARNATEGVGIADSATHLPVSQHIGGLIHSTEAAQIAEARRLGLPMADAADQFTRYGPRQGIDIQAAKDLAAGRNPSTRSLLNPQTIDRNNLPNVTGANFHRDTAYRDIPGGTEQINAFARQFAGTKMANPSLIRALKKQMWLEARANGVSPGIRGALGKQLDAKAIELADKLPTLPVEHATHGIELYTRNITSDVARSAEQHARTVSTAHAIYGFLGQNARHGSAMGSDAVPVGEALKALGMTNNGAATLVARGGAPMEGALVQGYRAMARQGAGEVTPFLNGDNRVLKKALDQYKISRAHYNELIATHAKWAMPQELAEPAGLFRQLTQTFKNFAYPIWLPAHVRNASSALANNLQFGTGFADHGLQGRLMRNTLTAKEAGKHIPLVAGMSDEEARQFIRRRQFATAKIGDGHAGQADLDNVIAAKLQSTTPGRITPSPFGSGKTGGGNMATDTGRLLGGAARDQAADTLQYIRNNPFQNPFSNGGLRSPIKNPFAGNGPLRQDGVFGGVGDNPALAAGRTAGANIEDYFRGAHWWGGIRKGADDVTAGRAVRDLHFDYDRLTKFEKNFMRTAIPFYTYMRKNLPLQLRNISSRPAIPMTQMRVMAGGRNKDDYVPEHLSGGVAIPIGGAQPGHERYISGFGTPLEEAMERFKFKNGMPDIGGTTKAFLASGNPFIKAPIEQLFDQQLSSGRKLSDLRPQGLAKQAGGLWGDDNPQLLSQVMANSPFTRFFSTFDKAADDRKPLWARAVNLGTGVRLTDVDMNKAKAIEAASARNEILSSMPHIAQYTNFYPRKGEEQNLTDQEVEMLRMLRTTQMRAKAQNESPAIGIAR